ncbi:MAG TPA: M20 family metallopeptidase [Chthoniobacterales bacterium]
MIHSVVELAQQLIAIPSVNPAGDPGTSATGERQMAEFLALFLESMGATVTLEEVLAGRPNVIGRFPSSSTGKPRLAFAPHTDTVGVRGMQVSPFSGEIRDGRLHGRGACDTKGPMAAQLWALWQMREEIPNLSHEIVFLGLADEEEGQAGSIAAAASEKLDFVVVAEPTSMQIVHTHKGGLWLKISTHGTAAHSSRPELGHNAIFDMGRILRCIEEQIAPQLAQRSHPVLGSPTISVGVIRGGQKCNVVPEYCEIDVDVRTIPGMEDFASELLLEIQKVVPTATMPIPKQRSALDTDVRHPLIAELQKLGCQPTGAPWFCDAASFAAVGVPAIAIGPGSISQAHTADEWIDVAELEAGADLFRQFLAGLR